jgi:hypothetical protein
VYTPSGEEVADPDLFAARVQQVIADALHVPCSLYTFEDSWIGGLVARQGLDPTACLVQWKSLQRVVPITRDMMQVCVGCGCVRVCTGVFRCVPVCTGVFRCVLVCSGVYGCVLVCSGVYGCVRVCTGVYGCVRVCTGVYG